MKTLFQTDRLFRKRRDGLLVFSSFMFTRAYDAPRDARSARSTFRVVQVKVLTLSSHNHYAEKRRASLGMKVMLTAAT